MLLLGLSGANELVPHLIERVGLISLLIFAVVLVILVVEQVVKLLGLLLVFVERHQDEVDVVVQELFDFLSIFKGARVHQGG